MDPLPIPKFITQLKGFSKHTAHKLAPLTIFGRRIKQKPHMKKKILYQHCQFTSFKIAFLINEDYAKRIVKYRTSKKNIFELVNQLVTEDNILFTINCFPDKAAGHSFSYIRYERRYYLIDSWYCQRGVTIEEHSFDEAAEYIRDYSRDGLHLSWDCCPIVIPDIVDNLCKYLKYPDLD
jgi:hypothetical protein